MQENYQQQLSIGLRKKWQQNDLDYYESLVGSLPFNQNQQAFGDQFIEQTLIPSIKQNPEQYFNFGFTYNDFKAYIMKITFCRALRIFIQKKRMQKIMQFQKNNPHAAFLCGSMEQQDSQKTQAKVETKQQ